MHALQMILWASTGMMLIAGCGGAAPARSSAQAKLSSRFEPARTELAQADAAKEAPAGAAKAANPDKAEPVRRIVYVAELKLVTPDFSTVEAAIPALVKKHGGYLSDAGVDQTSGERRTGRWVARVPVDSFDALMTEASELGVPESRKQNAEDISEQYIDLEARIVNAQGLEARIVKLLDGRAGELKHVIEIERELARVRSEIEQMEGRLRYLANRSALATVTILVREQRDYVPPQTPTYWSQLGDGWTQSVASLIGAGQDLTIAAACAAPWLMAMGVIVLPGGAVSTQAAAAGSLARCHRS